MTKLDRPTLAIRTNPENQNHHLFNNHGTWWCHYTVHQPDFTKLRVRTSLHTRNVQVARCRRDIVLAGRPDTSHPPGRGQA